jgi:hypothetical protein
MWFVQTIALHSYSTNLAIFFQSAALVREEKRFLHVQWPSTLELIQGCVVHLAHAEHLSAECLYSFCHLWRPIIWHRHPL